MLAQVLALTVRALREDARNLWPHALRLLFAAFLLLLLMLASEQSRFLSAPGLWVFQYVCHANFALITIGGLSVFATAITEEKEDSTLGLLRMAGIGPTGLLLGKSTTRLFTALLILAVQLPFTLLAITLGGVVWDQILAAYVALAAWLIAVANLGLFASVVCSRSQSAGSMTGLWIFTWLVGVPIAWLWAGQASRVSGGVWAPFAGFLSWLLQANIAGRLSSILSSGFNDSPWNWPVAANFLFGVGLFVVSCLTFDWFTRDHFAAAPPRYFLRRRKVRRSSPAQPVSGAGPGSANAPARPRQPFFFPGLSPTPAWNNALIWKDFHFLGGGYVSLAFKVLGYLAIILFFWIFIVTVDRGAQPWRILGAACLSIGLIGGAVEMGGIASRVFWEELRWQTWHSLVILPRSLAYLAYSKIAGMLLSLLPALLWVGVGLLLNLDQILESLSHAMDAITGVVFGVSYFLLFLHVTALLSVWLKHGALPLSFALVFLVGPSFVSCFAWRGPAGPGTAAATFGTFSVLLLIGSAVLHVAIAQRLRQLSEG